MITRHRHVLGILIVIFLIGCSSDDDAVDPAPNTGTTCQGGMAGDFPCNGIDLLSRITLGTFNAGSANDIWGWVDPDNQNEYAIVGLDNGTAFVNITDAENPVYLGKLPTATVNSGWRDIKVFGNHAFIVSEATGHGMQVFDLTQLRNLTNPTEFSETARYTGIGNAHNIVINEDEAFAYPVGTARRDDFNGGAHFIDISDPTNPTSVGGLADAGYSHDAQVITYMGPDTDHQGREIYVGSNESFIVIADITDKANPVEISRLAYDQVAYTHQGWFTEDHSYFILGDELDEQNFGLNSRTLIFDFTDLDNPEFSFAYSGPTAAIDHNGYVLGDEFYLANYTAGVRILDISDIENQNITETAFFDTFPNSNSTQFDGVWSVYPYFPSQNIVVSDINSGLFVLRKSN